MKPTHHQKKIISFILLTEGPPPWFVLNWRLSASEDVLVLSCPLKDEATKDVWLLQPEAPDPWKLPVGPHKAAPLVDEF